MALNTGYLKIRTEDKYFPRKVTTPCNYHAKDSSTIFNSSCWIALPLSFLWSLFENFHISFLLQPDLQDCSSVRCVAGCFLTLVFEDTVKSLPTCMFPVTFMVCCLRSFSVHVPTSMPLLFTDLVLYLDCVNLFSSRCFSIRSTHSCTQSSACGSSWLHIVAPRHFW